MSETRTVERVVCSVCGRKCRILKEGVFARHYVEYGHVCPNSGSEPQKERTDHG